MYFDRFIEFGGWPGLPEKSFEPNEAVQFLQRMQSEKFDLVLQMQGNGLLTNAMCLLWGATHVAGLRKEGDPILEQALFPVSGDDENEARRFLKLLDVLGIPSAGTFLEFPLSKQEELYFEELGNQIGLSPGEYVCIHSGSKDPKRRWPAEYFAAMGDQLAGLGYKVVLTGSAQEASVIKNVLQYMKAPAIDAVKAFAPMNLGKLGAVIKHSKLLLSNDTGVSHMAAAFQVPSVIIFSSYSSVSRWAPENSKLHHVITYEQSKDPLLVWRAVQQQLRCLEPKQIPLTR
jgi:ADP-heptose:LPS heptosyltransferase